MREKTKFEKFKSATLKCVAVASLVFVALVIGATISILADVFVPGEETIEHYVPSAD